MTEGTNARDGGHDRAEDPGHHSSAAGAPGASGPGEPGYDGEATIGDEGAAAGPESFQDPNGTTPEIASAAARALHDRVARDD
jgi:hypothetical protein